jgi:hypothetical protein
MAAKSHLDLTEAFHGPSHRKELRSTKTLRLKPRAVTPTCNMHSMLFENYKSFGGPLVATKLVSYTGDRLQTVTYTSITQEALADSVSDLPQAVRALQNRAK